MTEISDRYRRIAAGFTERVEAVPEDRWTSPSPCDEWDARGVVRHVVWAHGMFLEMVGRPLGDGPSVDDDPAAAWAAARDQVQADLDDPERAEAPHEGFFGPSTFEASVDRILAGDVLIHTWDLARATGLDERLLADEVAKGMAAFESMGDTVRTAGVFGPAVDPPEGADDQARLLCFTGRDPR